MTLCTFSRPSPPLLLLVLPPLLGALVFAAALVQLVSAGHRREQREATVQAREIPLYVHLDGPVPNQACLVVFVQLDAAGLKQHGPARRHHEVEVLGAFRGVDEPRAVRCGDAPRARLLVKFQLLQRL